ncbi:MAG: cysteine--tRNA ligase [bacterium]
MLSLYDTYTRKKRKFQPLKDKLVRIYACGPTVYSNAHIGNLSTFVFVDFLIRYLKNTGYKVKYVRNITDVGHLTLDSDTGEDKLEKASRKEGIRPLEIAKKYIQSFHKNTLALNLLKPDHEPRASQYIKEQIQATSNLIKKGFAYETSSGVYFDTTQDPEYGKLARLNLDTKSSKSRVCAIEDKKHPLDFAVWIKTAGKHKDHLQNWDSPWGKGFPGWHLECSVMSQKLLGSEFDIHCGGIDLAPVHHVNEIAQNKALYGTVPANFWSHKEHLQLRGAKMAKSTGNFITLDDLKNSGFPSDIFKFFVLSAHYRSKQEFNKKALEQTRENLKTIRNFLKKCQQTKTQKTDREIEKFWQEFIKALDDDLNSPKALATIFNLIKVVEKNNYKTNNKLILEKFQIIQDIFGIKLIQKPETKKIPEDIQKLLDQRLEARKQKDYKKSDQIRNKLIKKNIQIKDKGDGSQEIVYD